MIDVAAVCFPVIFHSGGCGYGPLSSSCHFLCEMLITNSSVVVVVVIVTLTPVMVKVPARNHSLHIARYDTWAQSIVSGYKGFPFHSM